VTSRADLRRWLAAHHEQVTPVWLVRWKKAAGERHVPYDAVVEEALCYGWVDSLPRALDAARSMLLLTPRKAGSTWSAANRARIERLEAAGRMTAAGRAKVAAAKADGSWDRLRAAETGKPPADLAKALRAGGTMQGLNAFTLATRKRLIAWLSEAKRAATRDDRIAKIVAGARDSRDPLDWRAAHPVKPKPASPRMS